MKLEQVHITCPHCGREYGVMGLIPKQLYYCIECLRPFVIDSEGKARKIARK